MGNTRLKNTNDKRVSQWLTTMKQSLDAIKSAPQYLGGASVVYQESDSGQPYDWTGTPADDATTYLLLTLTATTAPTLYASVITQLFVGAETTWYRPSDQMADQAAGDIPITATLTDVPNAPGLGTSVNQIIVSLNGDGTRPVWLKLYVYALDDVTLTLEAL